MNWDYVDLLSDLIRIPSVNPMGQPVVGSPYGEARLSSFIEERFHELGMAVERQQVESGRDNVIGRLDGSLPSEDGGPCLLIDVHQDTVGTAGMTIAPFEPLQREGRIYGRGACDVKGSLAVVLGVLSRLVRTRPARMPTVIVACTIDEENGFTGVRRLVQSWTRGRSTLLSRPPDAAIVAEPTELHVVVAHKGVLRWRCHTRGRAAHSSRPEIGTNAIYKMARVVGALESYANRLTDEDRSHPLLGHPTLSVGTISGGAGVNTVPDHCQIELDRRLLPDEDPTDVFREIQRYVTESLGADDQPDHDEPYLIAGGLDAVVNGPLAERLQAVAATAGTACRLVAVPFGTDAGAISQTGVPTVVFGPGSAEQAHTIDEWIAIEQLHRAGEILYDFCSGPPLGEPG